MQAALMQALMAGLTQRDPALAGRLEVLQNAMKQAEGASVPAEVAQPDTARRDRARQRIRRIVQRNAELERRSELLARALGACECWGERPACRQCGGRGRAGFYESDSELYALFVLPTVRARDEPAPADSASQSSGFDKHPQQEKP